MVCLLAAALPSGAGSRARICGDLITAIEGILARGIDTAVPVRADNLRFRWPPRGLGLDTLNPHLALSYRSA
jgi:hypothetical protein